MTIAFLDYAEDMAYEHKVMSMNDWINATDKLLKFREKNILTHFGKITHKESVDKAEREYEKYRVIQDQKYLSSMDEFYNKYLKEAKENNKS